MDVIRETAVTLLNHKGYHVLMDDFRKWIVAKRDGDDTIFVKPIYDIGKFADVDKDELQDEFEDMAAAWLHAVDPDDVGGRLRCDIINLWVVDGDRAMVRWSPDVFGRM